MPSEARLTAAACLMKIENGGFSNLVLSRELEAVEDQREAAFCTALVMETLARQLVIDYELSPFIKGGTERLDPEVRAVLRLGVCQIRYMDSVPDRAAVNESVELCKALRKSSAAGMVNAVLRNLIRNEKAANGNLPDYIRLGLNSELLELLKSDYPDSWQSIAEGYSRPAKTYFRVNTLKWSSNEALCELKAQGVSCSFEGPENCICVNEGFRECMEEVKKGRLHVQSMAAQYPPHLLSAKPGERVLDMCAAPGGKTACIAQNMNNRGSITALDIYPSRLKLIEKLAATEGIEIITVKTADASAYIEQELYDKVLCDVPCSGYGEIASKPELRYKRPEVSEELPELQYAILERGASLLKAGGRLVYSTCTILKRENEAVTERFLREHPEFEGEQIEVSDNCVIKGCELKFLPSENCSEGFYVAVFRRV